MKLAAIHHVAIIVSDYKKARREWQERNRGKYVLRYKGENITIMKSKFGAGWGVLYGGQSVFRYNNRRIDDFHTAQLG